MSTFLWLLLAVAYIVLFVTLALTTFRKGHYLLFWVGIIFPVLWIIGAIIARPQARTPAMQQPKFAVAHVCIGSPTWWMKTSMLIRSYLKSDAAGRVLNTHHSRAAPSQPGPQTGLP